MKETKMTITNFRKNLFEVLENLRKDEGSIVLEKDGQPVAVVKPYNKLTDGKTLLEVLKETQGILADDPTIEEDYKRLREAALEESEELKKIW